MHGLSSPSEWVTRWSHLLEPHSRVLDLACGAGRHMQHLASLGHNPMGIDRDRSALALAARWGQVLEADIENAPWPLPDQVFDAVVVTHYLWRPLFPAIRDCVAPGGVLLYETFSLEHAQFGRPSRPEFLLRPGELLELAAGWKVVAYEDGLLNEPERCVQRIAAIRPPASADADSAGPRRRRLPG